eukprot:4692213-Prymnesium_polylepis.1
MLRLPCVPKLFVVMAINYSEHGGRHSVRNCSTKEGRHSGNVASYSIIRKQIWGRSARNLDLGQPGLLCRVYA